ncbi:YraN family protein [Varibaculum cambriense]|uniref:YraN family protein n=1 Tax=Varibaculum cambriense TaxID=184870 RepID=UPI00290BDB94|nr:YraN family protein [Varibaculum cambriense]MDU5541727.1 YraN family protein [Varibaculum cambriense]
MGTKNREIGAAGEKLAARMLKDSGYQIIERNWRCRFGELDIICRDPHSAGLVFAEVKTRTTPQYGGAKRGIGREKYLRLRQLVSLWLSCHPEVRPRGGVRIDMIAIDASEGKVPVVTHCRGI